MAEFTVAGVGLLSMAEVVIGRRDHWAVKVPRPVRL